MQNENKLIPATHVRILLYYTPCHLYMIQAKNLLQCVSSYIVYNVMQSLKYVRCGNRIMYSRSE